MKKISFVMMFCLLNVFVGFILSGVYAQEQNAVSGDVAISLQELLNMHVTSASKTEEKLSDAPGVISVVTKDEMKRFGGNTLLDVLERVPSLSFSTAFFQDRAMISVRGDQDNVTGGHVLFLLNGRPVRESMEGGISSELLESFPISIINRIEVVRGPGSVLYGSDAFSGVINIITEEVDKIGGSVSGLAGVSGSWGAGSDLKIKAGDLKILFAARGADNEGWDVNNYRRYLGQVSPVPTPANPVTSQNFTIPDQQLGSYTNIEYKGLKIQSSYDQWYSEYFMRGALGQNFWTKWFNDVGYSLSLLKNWKMDFNVTYTNSLLASDSGYPYVARNSYDLVAEWTNFIELSEKSKLVIGGLYNELKGTEDLTSTVPQKEIANGDISAYAAYAQIDYRLLQSLKLIGGLQANKVGDRDIDVVPRAGIIWYPVDKISFKGLYGQAYRAPSIDETVLDHPGLKGNPDLNPEKVATTDIGVNYNADKIQAGVNYFYSQQKDIIEPDPLINPAYRVYENMSNITYQGVEVEGKYYLSTALFLTGSLLYQTNKDQSGKQNVAPTSNYYKKIGLSYMDNGITLSVFDIFNNGLDTANYNGTYNPSPKPFDILNANCNFDISEFFKVHAKPKFALNFYAENLFNSQYWMPEWGGIAHQTLPASPGRRLYLSAKVSL